MSKHKNPFNPPMKDYLGDGLYVEFDGYQTKLWANRDGMRHEVYLDSNVMKTLFSFVTRVANTIRRHNAATTNGEPDHG